jgi:hypothetical protein
MATRINGKNVVNTSACNLTDVLASSKLLHYVGGGFTSDEALPAQRDYLSLVTHTS